MCSPTDLTCHVAEGVQAVVANQFRQLSADMSDSVLKSLHGLATFWIKIDSPNLGTRSGDQWTDSGPVGFLHQHVATVSTAVFTLAVLVAGTRIAWEQRAEPLRQLLKATLLFIVVAAAGTATLQLLADWSDAFAVDLVTKSLPEHQTFETAIGGAVLPGGAEKAAKDLPLLLFIGAAGTVLIASLIQIVLLLIRSAMLVLLAATFPLAAAATNTEVGRTWFKKYCGWALAFIAYKPAAALIYAAAIKMAEQGTIGRSGDSLVQVLTGLMMLALAIVALPALLRFAVPVTAAVAGGSSAMGSAVTDPGGLASGAVSVGRSFAGGSSGGGPSGSAAAAGLGAAGGAITAAKAASGALAGAASHSAGEPGGGRTAASPSPRSRQTSRSSASAPPPPKSGPTGSTPR